MKSNWAERFAERRRRILFLRQRTGAHVATQIRALRESRDWSQLNLQEKSGILKSTISRFERIDYGKQTVSTLLRLAEAFDVGLDISFVSFSELWKRERKLAREPLAPPSYDEEIAQRNEHRRVPFDPTLSNLYLMSASPKYVSHFATRSKAAKTVVNDLQRNLWEVQNTTSLNQPELTHG